MVAIWHNAHYNSIHLHRKGKFFQNYLGTWLLLILLSVIGVLWQNHLYSFLSFNFKSPEGQRTSTPLWIFCLFVLSEAPLQGAHVCGYAGWEPLLRGGWTHCIHIHVRRSWAALDFIQWTMCKHRILLSFRKGCRYKFQTAWSRTIPEIKWSKLSTHLWHSWALHTQIKLCVDDSENYKLHPLHKTCSKRFSRNNSSGKTFNIF